MAPSKAASASNGDASIKIKFYWNHSQVKSGFAPALQRKIYIIAYEAVMSKIKDTGLTVPAEILIRGQLHDTTTKGGRTVPYEPHWTVGFKGDRQVQDGTYFTRETPLFSESKLAKGPVYGPIEGVESIGRYRPGGYHPAKIGDRLNDRYQIIEKLGHGGYSTVWLARDERTRCNVAVKIACADAGRLKEMDIMSSLTEDVRDADGREPVGKASIATVLDSFDLEGPNGTHNCLVMPAARCGLLYFHEPGEYFQLATARAIAAQIAQAVSLLHSKGIVHGDLTLGNVLLGLQPEFVHMSAEKLYEECGEPGTEDVWRYDEEALGAGVPEYGVVPAHFGGSSDSITLAEAKVFLSDFGESYRPVEQPRTYSNIPTVYRSPEQFLMPDRNVSFESDIWALGCLIFSIMGSRLPFGNFMMPDEYILDSHADALGRFPDDMWNLWEGRTKFWTEDFQRKDEEDRQTLVDLLRDAIFESRPEEGLTTLEGEEARAFEDLIRAMFAVSPEQRITAAEVLESEWMVKWALPDLKQAQDLWRAKEMEAMAQPTGAEESASESAEASTPLDGSSKEVATVDVDEAGEYVPQSMGVGRSGDEGVTDAADRAASDRDEEPAAATSASNAISVAPGLEDRASAVSGTIVEPVLSASKGGPTDTADRDQPVGGGGPVAETAPISKGASKDGTSETDAA